MDSTIIPEQAEDNSGDVLAVSSLDTGHTVSVIPQEDAGATKTQIDENKEAKNWRKSDKEWQEAQEAAKKGQDAEAQLNQIKAALKIEEAKSDQEPDVVKVLTEKMEALETKLALAEWEKSHPAVDTADNREAWQDIVKKKGHLVKSGDLTYDDLWAIIRKGSKPSTSNKDFKDQELNVGSIPTASKSVVTGSEIDPDVYTAMRKAGFTDEQIRLSA